MNSELSLNDRDIRSFLIKRLSQTSQSAASILIEELDLCVGEARVDLALVNGNILGIEIKSDCDNLERLPKQIEVYAKVFDQVEIVSGFKLFDQILGIVPDWWGIATVTRLRQGKLQYRKFRSCKKNFYKDPFSTAQLLWKREALDLLKTKSLDTKFKNKTRDVLWNALAENFPKTDVFNHVNLCLKSRKEWRFVHQLE